MNGPQDYRDQTPTDFNHRVPKYLISAFNDIAPYGQRAAIVQALIEIYIEAPSIISDPPKIFSEKPLVDELHEKNQQLLNAHSAIFTLQSKIHELTEGLLAEIQIKTDLKAENIILRHNEKRADDLQRQVDDLNRQLMALKNSR